MIIGIGIDLVECGRFLDWSAFKKQRIFTKKELEYILTMLRDEGEEKTFRYIRTHVLKGKPFPWEENK